MRTASPPKPVRVVLADMSRLTRELIRRILDEAPGVTVVREVSDFTSPFRQLVEETQADVVIVGDEASERLPEYRELLDERARLRILAVSADGREAHLYGTRSYEMIAETFSPSFVLEVVAKVTNAPMKIVPEEGTEVTFRGGLQT